MLNCLRNAEGLKAAMLFEIKHYEKGDLQKRT